LIDFDEINVLNLHYDYNTLAPYFIAWFRIIAVVVSLHTAIDLT